VDEMVRDKLVDRSKTFAQQDTTAVNAEAAMQAAGEAAYAEKQRTLSQTQGSQLQMPELGLGAATTGVTGLLIGVVATLALRRRRQAPVSGSDAGDAEV